MRYYQIIKLSNSQIFIIIKFTNFQIIKISAFTVFFGRAYQHFFREAPLRVLLWDEEWMSPMLAKFGIGWQDYATNPQTEKNIIFLTQSIGFLYFIAAISVFFIKKKDKINDISNVVKVQNLNDVISKVSQFLVILATINLTILAFCYTKDKFFHAGQFFEYAMQIGSPVALLLYGKINETRFLFFVKILCAFTFVCHGLYAMNFYTTPVDFVSMTMNGFNLEENAAKTFLYYIGIIDIIASILIFLPKINKIALIYMVIWGFLTSISRVYGYWHEGMFLSTLQQYWFHSLYRFCHFLLPLMCFFLEINKNQEKSVNL